MKFNNTEWPFNDSLVREITVNNFIDSLETELVIYNINLLMLFTGLLRRTHKKFPLIKKNNSLTAQMISRFISQSKYSKHKAEFLFVLDGFGMMTFVYQSERKCSTSICAFIFMEEFCVNNIWLSICAPALTITLVTSVCKSQLIGTYIFISIFLYFWQYIFHEV